MPKRRKNSTQCDVSVSQPKLAAIDRGRRQIDPCGPGRPAPETVFFYGDQEVPPESFPDGIPFAVVKSPSVSVSCPPGKTAYPEFPATVSAPEGAKTGQFNLGAIPGLSDYQRAWIYQRGSEALNAEVLLTAAQISELWKIDIEQANWVKTNYETAREQLRADIIAQLEAGLICGWLSDAATAHCPAGALLSDKNPVTIPAGRFFSEISKADANQQAQNAANSSLDCRYGNDAVIVTCQDLGFSAIDAAQVPNSEPESLVPPNPARRGKVTVPAGSFVALTKTDANNAARESALSQLECYWISPSVEVECAAEGQVLFIEGQLHTGPVVIETGQFISRSGYLDVLDLLTAHVSSLLDSCAYGNDPQTASCEEDGMMADIASFVNPKFALREFYNVELIFLKNGEVFVSESTSGATSAPPAGLITNMPRAAKYMSPWLKISNTPPATAVSFLSSASPLPANGETLLNYGYYDVPEGRHGQVTIPLLLEYDLNPSGAPAAEFGVKFKIAKNASVRISKKIIASLRETDTKSIPANTIFASTKTEANMLARSHVESLLQCLYCNPAVASSCEGALNQTAGAPAGTVCASDPETAILSALSIAAAPSTNAVQGPNCLYTNDPVRAYCQSKGENFYVRIGAGAVVANSKEAANLQVKLLALALLNCDSIDDIVLVPDLSIDDSGADTNLPKNPGEDGGGPPKERENCDCDESKGEYASSAKCRDRNLTAVPFKKCKNKTCYECAACNWPLISISTTATNCKDKKGAVTVTVASDSRYNNCTFSVTAFPTVRGNYLGAIVRNGALAGEITFGAVDVNGNSTFPVRITAGSFSAAQPPCPCEGQQLVRTATINCGCRCSEISTLLKESSENCSQEELNAGKIKILVDAECPSLMKKRCAICDFPCACENQRKEKAPCGENNSCPDDGVCGMYRFDCDYTAEGTPEFITCPACWCDCEINSKHDNLYNTKQSCDKGYESSVSDHSVRCQSDKKGSKQTLVCYTGCEPCSCERRGWTTEPPEEVPPKHRPKVVKFKCGGRDDDEFTCYDGTEDCCAAAGYSSEIISCDSGSELKTINISCGESLSECYYCLNKAAVCAAHGYSSTSSMSCPSGQTIIPVLVNSGINNEYVQCYECGVSSSGANVSLFVQSAYASGRTRVDCGFENPDDGKLYKYRIINEIVNRSSYDRDEGTGSYYYYATVGNSSRKYVINAKPGFDIEDSSRCNNFETLFDCSGSASCAYSKELIDTGSSIIKTSGNCSTIYRYEEGFCYHELVFGIYHGELIDLDAPDAPVILYQETGEWDCGMDSTGICAFSLPSETSVSYEEEIPPESIEETLNRIKEKPSYSNFSSGSGLYAAEYNFSYLDAPKNTQISATFKRAKWKITGNLQETCYLSVRVRITTVLNAGGSSSRDEIITFGRPGCEEGQHVSSEYRFVDPPTEKGHVNIELIGYSVDPNTPP